MGLEAMDPLTLDNQATVIEGAAKAIYSFFYVLVIIVLLNALVAVMSNVYNQVEVRTDRISMFCLIRYSCDNYSLHLAMNPDSLDPDPRSIWIQYGLA